MVKKVQVVQAIVIDDKDGRSFWTVDGNCLGTCHPEMPGKEEIRTGVEPTILSSETPPSKILKELRSGAGETLARVIANKYDVGSPYVQGLKDMCAFLHNRVDDIDAVVREVSILHGMGYNTDSFDSTLNKFWNLVRK